MKNIHAARLCLILFWSFTLTFAAGETNEHIKIVPFPSLKKVKTDDPLFVYIQVTNKGQEALSITGGKKHPSGAITPDAYRINSEIYKGTSGKYITVGGAQNAKSNGDGNRLIELKPNDSVVYRIEFIPFKKSLNGDFCHLEIFLKTFGAQDLMATLVIVRSE